MDTTVQRPPVDVGPHHARPASHCCWRSCRCPARRSRGICPQEACGSGCRSASRPSLSRSVPGAKPDRRGPRLRRSSWPGSHWVRWSRSRSVPSSADVGAPPSPGLHPRSPVGQPRCQTARSGADPHASGRRYATGGGVPSALAGSAGSHPHTAQACRNAERANVQRRPRAGRGWRGRRPSRARTRRAPRPSARPAARASRSAKPVRRRVRVGVERGAAVARVAWPPADGDLLRVHRVAHDEVVATAARRARPRTG